MNVGDKLARSTEISERITRVPTGRQAFIDRQDRRALGPGDEAVARP
jgi:hypothetical protein